MKLFKGNLILLLILTIAAFLRFYQLGVNPPSVNWDEAASGYNAYSILKTGRDEYGYFMPLFFRSFDDYKPPLYTYLVVPSVALFGLNNFAVRFPSAVLGFLCVLFTYLMVKELFKNKNIALISALFLAISPWHLQFSRVAFETNSAIFWSVLGTWAFLKGVNTKKKKLVLYMSLAASAFGANLFMYHNARVFVPMFTFLLIILFRKTLFKNLKYLIIPAIITTVVVAALVPILFSISGQLRFKGTTIFAIETPKFKASELISIDERNNLGIVGQIFHNRRFVYVPIIFENYLSHLRPEYLFLTADVERHHAPLIGLLYLWDLPFVLVGMYFLAKNKYPKSTKIMIFWWFLIAPLAASVTWGVPHSLRSEIYLPTFQIFSALGIYNIYQLTRRNKLFLSVAVTLLVLNFSFYLRQYYLEMPRAFSASWLYGRKEAVQITENLKNNYDRVIVSNNLEQPYMFWLYYLKYDPLTYIKNGGTVSGGFLEERNKFDKYLFKTIDYQKQKKEAKTLFVGIPDDFPYGMQPTKTIYYLDGKPAIKIVGDQN